MVRLWGVAPLALVAVIASSAEAGVYKVRDAVGGESVPGRLDAFYLAGTGSSPSGTNFGSPLVNLPMGTFDFEIDFTGSGSSFEQFRTYCLEPTQELSFHDNPTDDEGALYGTDTLMSSAPGMTALEASRIEILWANAFSDSMTSNIKAGAFQIIIWELIRDNTFDLNAGLTRLSTSNATSIAITAQANMWWANIIGGTWTDSQPLLALTSPDSQDLIIPVPTPGAVVLGAMGVMAAGSRRRRSV